MRDLALALLVLAGCAACVALAGVPHLDREHVAVAAATGAAAWCMVASAVWGSP